MRGSGLVVPALDLNKERGDLIANLGNRTIR